MNCPYCENKETNVLESRILPLGEGMRRRRECKKCGKRFTTYEKVANLDLKVVKKSGVVEEFDREKVMRGIKKACWKRPVTDEQMTALVDDIELKLLNRKTTKIPVRTSASVTMLGRDFIRERITGLVLIIGAPWSFR